MGLFASTPRKFGWIRDTQDNAAYRFNFSPHSELATTTRVDLRNKCPPIYDQGQLSACTATAVGAAYAYYRHLDVPTEMNFDPSILFLYYQERALEGTIDCDCGAILRDGYVALQQTGVCSTNLWPYVYSKYAVSPSDVAVQNATENKITSFSNIEQTLDQLKNALLNNTPLSFGFVVYESFMSIGRDGIMPLPRPGEAQLGGHAVLLVGFDDKTQRFIVRNSWGSGFGDGGYFYMPYEYALNNDYAGDFWALGAV